MFFETIFPLLAFAQLIGGSPLVNSSISDHIHAHVERAGCELNNMEVDVPRLDCPKKHQMNSEGHCRDGIRTGVRTRPGGENDCTSYCEVRITPRFGAEVPFNAGSCLSGDECLVTKGRTISYTRTWEISAAGFSMGKRANTPEGGNRIVEERSILENRDDGSSPKGIAGAFEAGASISFSKTVTYTENLGQREAINATHCGYWTFVPRLVESCGTLTRAEPVPIEVFRNEKSWCKKDKLQSIQNWCNTAPYMIGGQADGKVVFVLVDCGTNKLLPMDQQSEVYRHPGVSTGPPSGTKIIRRFVS